MEFALFLIGSVLVVIAGLLWAILARLGDIRDVTIPAIQKGAQTQITITADTSQAEEAIDRIVDRVRRLHAQLEHVATPVFGGMEGLREACLRADARSKGGEDAP